MVCPPSKYVSTAIPHTRVLTDSLPCGDTQQCLNHWPATPALANYVATRHGRKNTTRIQQPDGRLFATQSPLSSFTHNYPSALTHAMKAHLYATLDAAAHQMLSSRSLSPARPTTTSASLPHATSSLTKKSQSPGMSTAAFPVSMEGRTATYQPRTCQASPLGCRPYLPTADPVLATVESIV